MPLVLIKKLLKFKYTLDKRIKKRFFKNANIKFFE